MKALEVLKLNKSYETFSLENVSFSLEEGTIMGFIGRNGAGKTTTLKCLLNFVHPNSGDVRFFGESLADKELEIKQKIGFVSGGVDYYPKQKLKTITQVTKSFYREWDDAAYSRYMKMFALIDTKTPEQLSAGMRVKYSLALALSHNAKLLLLDEPTSGLDPVSRDDLLDVFLNLSDEGITILFSTHITSDLDKCADTITYIKAGKIIDCCNIKSFVNKYKVVSIKKDDDSFSDNSLLIGKKRSKEGYSALIAAENACKYKENHPCEISEADLEQIMVHLEHTDKE